MTFVSAAEFAARNILISQMLYHSQMAHGAGASLSIGWEPYPAFPQDPFIAANGDEIELRVPMRESSTLLRCHLKLDSEHPLELRQLLGRAQNHQRSGQLVAGLVLLLSVCGWTLGGNEAACALVVGATPPDAATVLSPEAMRRHFGARPLDPSAVPGLFDTTAKIARRAGLQQLPKLYFRAGDDGMNAYALGGPDASAITLTDGLLRGLRPAEIAGILAHEIAHICNSDTWTMAFANGLQKTIAAVAPAAFALAHPGKSVAPLRPFEALLSYAPTLAQLLYLGLSRTREHDADAMALQLTDDPHALVTALAKLEHHYNGPFAMSAMAPDEEVALYFNSHPRTSDRVGKLLNLAGAVH